MTDMKILITGVSGLIGQALSKELIARGHTTVAAVRRSPRRNDEVQWDPQSGVMAREAFQGIDAVVHLAGAGIGDKRWTDSYKMEIRSFYNDPYHFWRSKNNFCAAKI